MAAAFYWASLFSVNHRNQVTVPVSLASPVVVLQQGTHSDGPSGVAGSGRTCRWPQLKQGEHPRGPCSFQNDVSFTLHTPRSVPQVSPHVHIRCTNIHLSSLTQPGCLIHEQRCFRSTPGACSHLISINHFNTNISIIAE